MSKNIANLARQSPPIDTSAPYNTATLQDKTIVITGGASGFGAGFARQWASWGANIIIGDVDTVNGKALIEEICKATGNAAHHFIFCDVTNWQSQVDFFRTSVELSPHGRLDQVVANAGVRESGAKFDEPKDLDKDEPPKPDWKAIDVNLMGVLYTSHLAIFWLPRNSSPSPDFIPDRHLLLIGSVAALIPFAGQIQYSIAKHGVLGLFRSLRATSWKDGIRVNLLCPYFIDTPLIPQVGRAFLAGIGMGKQEDVVEAASRFVADTSIRGRALVVGPKIGLDLAGHLLPPNSQQSEEITTFELLAHDLEEVEAFTARYVRILNAVEAGRGYLGWATDMIKAVLYPFTARTKG